MLKEFFTQIEIPVREDIKIIVDNSKGHIEVKNRTEGNHVELLDDRSRFDTVSLCLITRSRSVRSYWISFVHLV